MYALAHAFAKYNATPAAYIVCGCVGVHQRFCCIYLSDYMYVRLVCITLAQYFILFM